MPPRKSDSSKVATGDEGSVVGTTAGTSIGASTAARKDDGVNIEVIASIQVGCIASTYRFDRISTSQSLS